MDVLVLEPGGARGRVRGRRQRSRANLRLQVALRMALSIQHATKVSHNFAFGRLHATAHIRVHRRKQVRQGALVHEPQCSRRCLSVDIPDLLPAHASRAVLPQPYQPGHRPRAPKVVGADPRHLHKVALAQHGEEEQDHHRVQSQVSLRYWAQPWVVPQ